MNVYLAVVLERMGVLRAEGQNTKPFKPKSDGVLTLGLNLGTTFRDRVLLPRRKGCRVSIFALEDFHGIQEIRYKTEV